MAKKHYEKVAEHLKSQAEGAEPKPAQDDLDSREVQQRIMDPNGTVIELSYGSITLYPYAMRDKRRAGGFLTQVFADAVGGGARSAEELQLRTASLLMRRDDLENELFRLAAVACFKPGQATDEKVIPIVVEFQSKCASDDIFNLFAAVSDLAEFKAPKT